MRLWEKHGLRRAADILAVLILTAGLCACGVEPQAVPLEPEVPNAALPPEGELGYRLLCTLPNLNSQNLTLMARGIQDHCDYLGIDITMHNSHDDHLAQAVAIDEFIAGGGQAVLCQPVDTAALQPFFQVARQQGAVIVTWGQNADANASLTFDDRAAGKVLARDAAAWAKKQDGQRPAAAVLISGNAASGFAAGVAEGYAESFPEEEADIQSVEMETETLAEDLLALMPASGIILADSDANALLARQQLAAYWEEEFPDMEPPDWGRYYFGGFGATLEGLAALEEGTLQASVGEDGYRAGQRMVDMAVQLLQGAAVETQAVTPVLVDKTNASEYN